MLSRINHNYLSTNIWLRFLSADSIFFTTCLLKRQHLNNGLFQNSIKTTSCYKNCCTGKVLALLMPTLRFIEVYLFSPVFFVCQLCFWRFWVHKFNNYLLWVLLKLANWEKHVLEVCFLFNSSNWENFFEKATNNCQIIDWKTSKANCYCA